ncbi:MAG: hypothetical protein PWP31_1325 [Clostridia bacterium]|nr:hypothetical protein [Clostridia bacterium]
MDFDRLTKQRYLEKSLAQLALIVESSSDAIIGMNLEGKITSWNKGAEKIFGYSFDEIIGSHIFILFPFASFDKVQQLIMDIKQGKRVRLYREIRVRKDGKKIYISSTISPIKDNYGSLIGISEIARDVTELRKAEEVLKKYELLSNNAHDIILIVRDSDHRILEANNAAVKTYGYTQEELLNMTINDLRVSSDGNELQEGNREEGIIYEAVHRRKDGSTFPVEVSSQGGVEIGNERVYLKIVRDITERKLMEKRLRYYYYHDTLTGIYNRAFFEEKMCELEKSQSYPVGILVCDVDGLKLVNDTMGHSAGDKLLVDAAKIIKNSFRQSDFVARIGGDEFAVLLNNTYQNLEKAYRRIKKAIQRYNLSNPELPISISVGFASTNNRYIKLSEVFKEADNNMYREKLFNGRSSRNAIVKSFKEMLDARDFITEGHVDRLKSLVERMGKSLGFYGQRINSMRLLAKFHDIGKIGIPDRILFKKGRLTPEEQKEMQRHCDIGHRIARSVPELSHIADLILKHHEWWNGKGYPLGLKGKEIPLECRVLAILDAYDAMTNDRPYRKAMPKKDVLKELERYAGIQFDPNLVEKFIKVI